MRKKLHFEYLLISEAPAACLQHLFVHSLLILPGDLPLHRLPCWALSYIPGKVALAQNNPHLFSRIFFHNFHIFYFVLLAFFTIDSRRCILCDRWMYSFRGNRLPHQCRKRPLLRSVLASGLIFIEH